MKPRFSFVPESRPTCPACGAKSTTPTLRRQDPHVGVFCEYCGAWIKHLPMYMARGYFIEPKPTPEQLGQGDLGL